MKTLFVIPITFYLIHTLLWTCSSGSPLGSEAKNEMILDKRMSEDKMRTLIKLYDDAIFDTWNVKGLIPHWDCQMPFRIYHTLLNIETYGPYFCRDDASGDIWCSIDKNHRPQYSKWKNCILKGTEVADPKKWKAPENCATIFRYYHKEKRKYYYYKGCTTAGNGRPWCSLEIDFTEGKAADCIDLTPRWTDWSEWSGCSATCGGGSRTRSRQCQSSGEESTDCSGDNTETSQCNQDACSVPTTFIPITEVVTETEAPAGPAIGSLGDYDDYTDQGDEYGTTGNETSEAEAMSSSNRPIIDNWLINFISALISTIFKFSCTNYGFW